MNVLSFKNQETPGQVTVTEAARALGLDTFTFYTLIQRDRVAPIFAAGGEIVVAEADVISLASKKDVPC